MSVMGVCVSTLHWYDWTMYAIGQQMSVMDLCFSTFQLYPGHLSHVGQQSARHRVVFSTLGLYLAHLATQVNKLSIRDLLVSTFISSRYTQVYPWWSLAGVWYDQFVVHSNCIWALVRSDGHRFLPLLERWIGMLMGNFCYNCYDPLHQSVSS